MLGKHFASEIHSAYGRDKSQPRIVATAQARNKEAILCYSVRALIISGVSVTVRPLQQQCSRSVLFIVLLPRASEESECCACDGET